MRDTDKGKLSLGEEEVEGVEINKGSDGNEQRERWRVGREGKKSATDQQTGKEHTGRLIRERFDFRDSRWLNYTLSGTKRIDGARK